MVWPKSDYTSGHTLVSAKLQYIPLTLIRPPYTPAWYVMAYKSDYTPSLQCFSSPSPPLPSFSSSSSSYYYY